MPAPGPFNDAKAHGAIKVSKSFGFSFEGPEEGPFSGYLGGGPHPVSDFPSSTCPFSTGKIASGRPWLQ